MKPEVVERLGHVLDSIRAIEEFVAGLTFEEYSASRIHRRAVEREFEIIAESLSAASRLDPTLSDSIPEIGDIIGLYRRVVQSYETVNDTIVWVAIHEDLPTLR